MFEHCVLDRFKSLLASGNNQFGFMIGCNHTVYTAREIVNKLISILLNLCTIDLSKAFDKVNHHALENGASHINEYD